jgi:hypothetical protein
VRGEKPLEQYRIELEAGPRQPDSLLACNLGSCAYDDASLRLETAMRDCVTAMECDYAGAGPVAPPPGPARNQGEQWQ